MEEIRHTRVDQGQTKIRNVPIAVTPEGFWCCPSPVMFQKNIKTQNSLNKPKSSSQLPKPSTHKKQTLETDKKPAHSTSKSALLSDDNRNCSAEAPVANPSVVTERMPRPKTENLPRKVSIEFGEAGTSDLRIVLSGKQGLSVKLSVHKSVLVDNSSFFAEKILVELPGLPCIEIDDCEDVEIYVETVGLMYCKEVKQRLIRQSVSRVLRILKIAEQLGFNLCIQSCLEYLEAVPWVGEEEEEKVVSSVLRLQNDGIGVTTPILKRVASDNSKPCKDTLSHILQLVLTSNEEKSRREMKKIVLKLLRENNTNNLSASTDICNTTIYSSCKSCFVTLLSLFKQATESDFASNIKDVKERVLKQISLEADNLIWLLEILSDRHGADEFAAIWASQQELAALHPKLPVVSRYNVSGITARVFVGIGRGEILPSKDTRHLLLQTWLEPLINDYGWLQNGCRSFDRNVVEEGIGRTILTLPLEDQQSILLSWLSTFLKAGDSCPNLQRAFEVWWRRTFVRPYVEQQDNSPQQRTESSMT